MHTHQRAYEKEIANAENFFNQRVDGLIASLTFETENLDHFKPFNDKGIPLVFFDRVEENNDYNTSVIIDNYKCGYQATRHLIEQGCKRIAIATSSLKRNVYRERHRGYKDALHDNGLTYSEKLVIINDLSEKAATENANRILKMNPLPDGIFITHDFSAAICMQVLIDHGINIPADIAIVGFNNDDISKLVQPRLTTINYPGKDLGEIAARNLIDQLNNNKLIANNKQDHYPVRAYHSSILFKEDYLRMKEIKFIKKETVLLRRSLIHQLTTIDMKSATYRTIPSISALSITASRIRSTIPSSILVLVLDATSFNKEKFAYNPLRVFW